MQNIFYIGGKSGGHIVPLLSLIKNKKKRPNNENEKIIFITTNSKLDHQIINDAKDIKIDLHTAINLDNIPSNKKELFYYFFNLIKAFFKIFILFWKQKPHIIYTTGGYISVISCVIALLFRPKIILYCLDVYPGKAVRLIAKFANEVHIIFEETKQFLEIKKENCFVSKMPIRFTKSDIKDRTTIADILNIDIKKTIIFIIGGSQGSTEITQIFFESILSIINENKSSINNFFCIHQTGNYNLEIVKNWYKQNNINAIVFGYQFNLSDYYNVSDLVITRAGAITLSELAFFKKKTLIIPLKNFANDHQTINAISFSRNYKFMNYVINQKIYKKIVVKFIKSHKKSNK
jgi:UDP-N-acetylglucosamine--N-acetylmuramyl-(pentapeptide) pyrophosphoryl-undecaprenol N-acetylglucosamine transferase